MQGVLCFLSVFLAGQLGIVLGIKCYVGESVNRVAPFGVPLECNNTATETYDQCWSICQTMDFTNTSGDLLTRHICAYGCGSLSLCNIMEQRQTGMFIVPICNCYWDLDEVYWTQLYQYGEHPENRFFKKLIPQKDPPPIPFCCPKCRRNLWNHPEGCPPAYSLKQKCCATDGCNSSTAAVAASLSSFLLMLCMFLLALYTNLQGFL